jgi:hypothetical protein
MMWVLPLLLGVAQADPAPELTRKKSRSRNLDCERVSDKTADRQYPGRIFVSESRGLDDRRSIVVCRERIFRNGFRDPGDEAVLWSLEARANEFAVAAASARPEWAARTWLVESFHPSSQVSGKLSFATKNALMGQGLTVSDRAPLLGAGDIAVITRMDPYDAYPVACKRYHDTGAMSEGDALLAVITLDPRETAVHAGVCVDGDWAWLQ